eukprot:SAG11_NODE_2757_length_3006_cov_3.489164_2_plen_79_part_00
MAQAGRAVGTVDAGKMFKAFGKRDHDLAKDMFMHVGSLANDVIARCIQVRKCIRDHAVQLAGADEEHLPLAMVHFTTH